MSDKNTGGSAFPQEVRYIAPNGETGSHGPCGGMTLRDYFAAKAMQGAVSGGCFKSDADWKTEAKHAYGIADAMLKARQS